jgi:C4-dicarboxylate-specific signal transduction histidine kinase
MTGREPDHERVEYILGQERGVSDILRVDEVRPLLRGAVQAGAAEATLLLDGEVPLCVEQATDPSGSTVCRLPLYLEGEVVGTLVVRAAGERQSLAEGIGTLLATTLQIVLQNNLKRMLTTDLHTSVITSSYDELVEKHRALSLSEARLKELADSLEQQVSARTAELELTMSKLVQREKLAAVGQLAAGAAHEINTPIGIVTSNLTTLQKYLERLNTLIDWVSAAVTEVIPEGQFNSGFVARRKELKIDFICEDGPVLIRESLANAGRVARIIADLKGYSHVDGHDARDFDLAEELGRTLTVLKSRLPSDVRIDRDLAPLPRIRGDGALFCQVISGLVTNSVQARSDGLHLSFRACRDGDAAEIAVSDNGPGIPEAVRSRVFDPFFTTREVGQGIGMGLTVAHDIITGWGGSIQVSEGQDKGATFLLHLPLASSGEG